MTVAAVIPARGGSKRIPRKNLALCGGKPLLAWSAMAALGAKSVDRIILSTDDEEIAEAGRGMQVEVPFMRPANLAGDMVPMISVMQHAVSWLRANGGVELVVLLQPSSPLRTSQHIDDAITLYRAERPASVVSVVAPPHRFNPVKLLIEDEGGLQPYIASAYRPGAGDPADLPRVYARNGPAIVVSRADDVLAGEFYRAPSLPFVMAEEESVDVDTPFDLAVADCLLRRREQTAASAEP